MGKFLCRVVSVSAAILATELLLVSRTSPAQKRTPVVTSDTEEGGQPRVTSSRDGALPGEVWLLEARRSGVFRAVRGCLDQSTCHVSAPFCFWARCRRWVLHPGASRTLVALLSLAICLQHSDEKRQTLLDDVR